MRSYYMVPTLALFACRPVDPAPEDLDALLHYFWQKADTGSDAEIVQGFENLALLTDAMDLEQAEDGSVTRLTAEETASLGTPGDPTLAAGVYMVNRFKCSDAALRDVFLHPDQMALYPGVYDTYERDFDGSIDAFKSGEDAVMSWRLDYSATLLGSTYSASTRNHVRQLDQASGELIPTDGNVLVWKTHMPEAAVFESGNRTFDQDYQIDLYFPDGDEMVHVYAIWRQGFYGAGLTMDSEGIQVITLNNMIRWDDGVEEYCNEGLPEVE